MFTLQRYNPIRHKRHDQAEIDKNDAMYTNVASPDTPFPMTEAGRSNMKALEVAKLYGQQEAARTEQKGQVA